MNEFFSHPLTLIVLSNSLSLGFLLGAFWLGTWSNRKHLEGIIYQDRNKKRDTITSEDRQDQTNKILKARKRAESIYNAK